MLEDYLNLKVVKREQVLTLVSELVNLGFKLDLFTSNLSANMCLNYNEDFIVFDDHVELFKYLLPLVEKANELVTQEEKKSRLMRELMLDACDVIAHKFNKEIYTFSLGRKEN